MKIEEKEIRECILYNPDKITELREKYQGTEKDFDKIVNEICEKIETEQAQILDYIRELIRVHSE